jgi:zinc transporter, ZIP family
MGELLRQAFTYLPFAVAAGIAGGIVAVVRPPGDMFRSIVQHLAAGILTAIIAVDLVPEIRSEGEPIPVLIGFAIGSVLMIIIKGVTWRVEDSDRTDVPAALVGVSALDTAIDGAIIGVAFATSGELGVLLTIGLGIELFVLTLSVGAELEHQRVSRGRIVATTTGIALLLALGALGGILLLGDRSAADQANVLAFAVAALLYLVAEELLIKGHDAASRGRTTAAFFIGFLALMAFTLLVG